MNAAALSPEQLRDHLDSLRDALPPTAGPVLDRLRQQSAWPAGALADPLADPGGTAADLDRQDGQREQRRQIKVLLAGGKLHAGLIVAALGRESDPSAVPAEPLAAATAAWVERATRWIEAATDALARQWGSPAAGGSADSSGEAVTLSDYHRYRWAQILVAVLQQRPEWLEQVEPDRVAAYLAAPAPGVPAEPAAPPWTSAGREADARMAWSRALARVLETAADTPFNRPLDEVLADARVALAAAVERQTQALTAAPALTDEARPIVELHALQVASRLYAATLRHVYHESTRMIQSYQDLLQQGQEDAADQLAQTYQDRRLGYAGVPHYFRQFAALHEHQQEAARSAVLRDPERADAAAPTAVPARPVVPGQNV